MCTRVSPNLSKTKITAIKNKIKRRTSKRTFLNRAILHKYDRMLFCSSNIQLKHGELNIAIVSDISFNINLLFIFPFLSYSLNNTPDKSVLRWRGNVIECLVKKLSYNYHGEDAVCPLFRATRQWGELF